MTRRRTVSFQVAIAAHWHLHLACSKDSCYRSFNPWDFFSNRRRYGRVGLSTLYEASIPPFPNSPIDTSFSYHWDCRLSRRKRCPLVAILHRQTLLRYQFCYYSLTSFAWLTFSYSTKGTISWLVCVSWIVVRRQPTMATLISNWNQINGWVNWLRDLGMQWDRLRAWYSCAAKLGVRLGVEQSLSSLLIHRYLLYLVYQDFYYSCFSFSSS